MDNSTTSLDARYNKLATGYSKLRGQVTVLRQALLDEQTKSSTMRETLRQKDTALRRAEQEVDSLGFRNKQLEHRVAALQEDFRRELKQSTIKSTKGTSKTIVNNNNKMNDVGASTSFLPHLSGITTDAIFTADELQKKILENAQLTSMLADSDADMELYRIRIDELEQQQRKRANDYVEMERKLRKDLELMQAKNSTLEAKLAESVSIVGSEDALSCSETEQHTPIHRNSTTSSNDEQRIAQLEKDVFHWKTKYEICKITNGNPKQNIMDEKKRTTITVDTIKLNNGPCSSTTITTIPVSTPTMTTATTMTTTRTDDWNGELQTSLTSTTEQLIHNHFLTKFDHLFAEKCLAESKLHSYRLECDSLFNNLEILTNELDDKEQKYIESQKGWQRCEEDLATTRTNYEEQITVLTEQVISLSDQLAALK